MKERKILFICGSMNQTTMMHKISQYLTHYDLFFTPFYGDGHVRFLAEHGLLNMTILAGQFRAKTEEYLKSNNLAIDYRGERNNYDLVFLCSDLIVPENIRNKKVILVQEGMTDKTNVFYYLSKLIKLPRYMAGTAINGQSHAYDYFCVASEGYKNFFIQKGINPEKIKVTGIPNFDNAASFLFNKFPHKGYVLVATSDLRETFKYENRKRFIRKCLKIADGRKVIFKLHPNENFERAIKEIKKYAPDSIIYTSGNTNHMVANCDVLITRYSSVVYIGLILGKEVYSSFDLQFLTKLVPLQNGGTAAQKIAEIGEQLLEEKSKENLNVIQLSDSKKYKKLKQGHVRINEKL